MDLRLLPIGKFLASLTAANVTYKYNRRKQLTEFIVGFTGKVGG